MASTTAVHYYFHRLEDEADHSSPAVTDGQTLRYCRLVHCVE